MFEVWLCIMVSIGLFINFIGVYVYYVVGIVLGKGVYIVFVFKLLLVC